MAHKRGNVYWYDFWVDGERYQKSTRVRKKADAEIIESALKTEIAKAAVGIKPQRKGGPAPRFDVAMREFLKWCEIEHAEKAETRRRYQVSSRALLEHFKQGRIDQI